MCVWPGASGGPVGRLVFVGNRAAHDVVAHGGGLVTLLGVGADVAGVAMSNVVAMIPAVARRVRSPPLPAAAPGPGCKLLMESLDLVG